MADAFEQGQATNPLVDSLVPGKVIGEQTLDGNRVITYPHRDRGTPKLHYNMEDKAANSNTHLVIE